MDGPKKGFLDRLAAGTESAAYELDRSYRRRLCALVEREMGRRYRRREDPEDVVQSVLRTFFRRSAEGQFQIDHPEALWGLLQKITRRKLLKHVEKNKTIRRNIDKEEYVDDCQLPARGPVAPEARLVGDVLETALADLEPVDSGVLRLQLFGYSIAEIVEVVLSGLESPYPEILQWRLQGLTETQIAKNLGCGREAIRYRLQRICDRLSKLLREEPDPGNLRA